MNKKIFIILLLAIFVPRINAMNQNELDHKLITAVSFNNVNDTLEAINNGANTNAKATLGWTPLHYAAYFFNAESAKLLIEHNAQVNAQNDSKQTALHLAANID